MSRIARKEISKTLEEKLCKLSVLASPVSATGLVQSLTGAIPQGTGDGQRVGNRIKPTRIDIAWTPYMLVAAADPHGQFRFIIFQWLVDDTVDAPSPAALLSVPGTPVVSMYNHDMRYKYRILYDEVLSVCNTGMSIAQAKLVGIKPSVPHTDYMNAASALGTNQLYMYIVTNGATVGSYLASYAVDVYFTDA